MQNLCSEDPHESGENIIRHFMKENLWKATAFQHDKRNLSTLALLSYEKYTITREFL